MKLRTLTNLSLLTLIPICITNATAAVIVGTDFVGRTVSGTTASNITYTTTGVVDPGDLTSSLGSLFDSSHASHHFAPSINTDSFSWTVIIPLTFSLDTSAIQIGSDDLLVIDYQHFNSVGSRQSTSRTSPWTASIVGSSSGIVLTDTATSGGNSGGTINLFDSQSVTLDNTETWSLQLTVGDNDGSGNRTGINNFALNGSAITSVPEPSSTALIGLFGVTLILRRRRE